MSLKTLSASCDRKFVIVMYLSKTIILSNVTFKLYIPITSCVYMTQLSVYMPYVNPMKSTMWPGTQMYLYFTLLANAPPKYACNCAHICSTALLLWLTYRPYITVHTCPKINNLQQTLHGLLPNMYQKQIYPSNATYANYFMCTYQTTMSAPIPHMNLLHATVWAEALLYLHNISHYWHMHPKQICLPHLIHMSHCTNTIVHI